MLSLSTSIQPLSSPRFLSNSPPPPPPPRSSPTTVMASSARIAVVGDVHEFWNLEEDTKALQLLRPDLVLFTGMFSCWFTSLMPLAGLLLCCILCLLDILYSPFTNGDFGNENVELVQSIANLGFPKAVILGNHDAWSTRQFSDKKKDNVQLQLECLGEDHVGYRRLDFPALKLSVVGGRPFSCGGDHFFREKLLRARFGVQDMEGSAKRIYNAALETPEDHLIIFLTHNGPTGLGSNLNDICGKDWVLGAGDHGDPDLEEAISHLKETTELDIPLVVFGHMHKELAYGNGVRKMIMVGTDLTIYLNGAIVPRVKGLTDDQGTAKRSFIKDENSTSPIPESAAGTLRAFTLVEILEGRVDKIAETWVSVVGEETKLEQEEVLFKWAN